MMYFQV